MGVIAEEINRPYEWPLGYPIQLNCDSCGGSLGNLHRHGSGFTQCPHCHLSVPVIRLNDPYEYP